MISVWWLVALAFFGVLGIAWLGFNQRDDRDHSDQIDDDLDRHIGACDARFLLVEQWIMYLDGLARHGDLPEGLMPYRAEGDFVSRHIEVLPLDEPNFVVDVVQVDDDREQGPETVPMPVPMGPATQPAHAVIANGWRDLDEMYAEAMASIDAIGKGPVTPPRTIAT